MIHIVTQAQRFFRRFRKSDAGNGTIEFVIIFPAIFMIFISSFELGLLSTRHSMLERGVDLTVRDLRLGNNVPYTYNQLKGQLCANSSVLPKCRENMRLEMIQLDPRQPNVVQQRVSMAPDCVDVSNPIKPVRNFDPDVRNQIMYLRVCVLFEPLFPAAALGARLPHHSGELYALVASTAYATEPD